jgi:hypothetical protein
MRVFRLMKLMNLFEGCEVIMLTCRFAWPRLAVVMQLLAILIFFFANVAVVLFGHYSTTGSLYVNFESVVGAMQLLFVLMTGDNWNGTMGEFCPDQIFVMLRLERLTFSPISCAKPT